MDLTLFHGSNKHLTKGTVLRGRGDAYIKAWSNCRYYRVLEVYRPHDKLPHHDAVFAVGNRDDLSIVGEGEYTFTIKPLGPVSRHDINMGSKIETLLNNGFDVTSYVVKSIATDYWNGVPSEDPLWEYLTESAEILEVEKNAQLVTC